jgi:glucoamylase
MLPEQVWDEPDRPGQSRRFGQCAGAAMPLMWAHAEYIKLLRSAQDGQVFDRIPIVAARYLNKRGRKDLEVWKPTRRLRMMSPGKVLRIQAEASFRLRWTFDEWQNVLDSASIATNLGAHFVDIPVSSQQKMPFRFTFLWTETKHWEGRNYEVGIRD